MLIVSLLVWLVVEACNAVLFALALPLGAVAVLIAYSQQGKAAFRPPQLFAALRPLPLGCGKVLLAKIIGMVNPYGGSIGSTVEEWTGTSVCVSMADRPWLRNPFRSVHAVALTNLAELASGMAVMGHDRYKPGVRAIVLSLSVDFKKKARGTITARAEIANFPTAPGDHNLDVRVPLRNADGVEVATGVVKWRISLPDAKPKTK